MSGAMGGAFDMFGGAAGGAVSGSMISPGVGTVIGAAIGGLSSLFGGMAANKANQQNTAAANAAAMEMQQRQMAFDDYVRIQSIKTQADFMQQAENFDWASAGRQMDFNATQAQIQRDWQQQMANTAYQRSVADMRAAGLNPILGVASGGAATPSGAVATGSAPTISVPTAPTAHGQIGQVFANKTENVIGPAVGNALQAFRAFTDAQATAAQIENVKADTVNKVKTGGFIDAQTGQAQSETALKNELIKTQGFTQRQLDEAVRNLRTQEDLNRANQGLAGAQTTAALLAAQKSQQDIATGKQAEEELRQRGNMTRRYGDIRAPLSLIGQPVGALWNDARERGLDPNAQASPGVDVSPLWEAFRKFWSNVTGSGTYSPAQQTGMPGQVYAIPQ